MEGNKEGVKKKIFNNQAATTETTDKSGSTVHGLLSSVTESRLTETMRAVDPFESLLCRLFLNPIQRQSYSLSLWHIDGYQKLIQLRFVIHGGTDGYSRKIMYLCASNNNRPSTVQQTLMGALQKFSLPHCVNVRVERFKLEHPLDPWTREELFQPVYTARGLRGFGVICCSQWLIITTPGALDPDDETHILCLHYVTLPRINMHFNVFRQTWD
ncbi:uncharacterized protein LOC121891856 [Thunnus maccoyii]|uniref:uncharacterized protein LOC121891856 n=1 Tax=Thunnus maccoyii TaxID=8240 RepID=UPI001C4AD8F4|nr:uncharacterized protein LOC121891856 [Thunnus maccoyii]